LLKELAEHGSLKFSELEMLFPRLSPRTLSQRLRTLADEDIIMKAPYSLHPLRFEYRLSAKGSDLIAILRAMANWGEKYPSLRATL
jgi:DNA-binding HxlR family transcriptional regulator